MGGGGLVSELFYKEAKSKLIFLGRGAVGGRGRGRGARVRGFFFHKVSKSKKLPISSHNPNLN